MASTETATQSTIKTLILEMVSMATHKHSHQTESSTNEGVTGALKILYVLGQGWLKTSPCMHHFSRNTYMISTRCDFLILKLSW
jgi:hypothetical protein